MVDSRNSKLCAKKEEEEWIEAAKDSHYQIIFLHCTKFKLNAFGKTT